MRKALIVTLGLGSLVALGTAPPAFADTRTICQWRFSGAYIGDWETGPLGIGVKVCKQVEVQIPKTPWQGNSGSAVKTYTPSTNLKNR